MNACILARCAAVAALAGNPSEGVVTVVETNGANGTSGIESLRAGLCTWGICA